MTIRVSEGAKLLAAAGSITRTAELTGFSERSISGYRSGRRTPDGPHAAVLERELGIPKAAWSRMASTTEPAPRAAEPPQRPATSPALAPEADDRQSAEVRLREQMARLRAQREAGGLTATATATLERLELQASVALAKLEGAHLTEAQVAASPHFLRLLDIVIDTLRTAHPLGLFEVLNAVSVSHDVAPTFHLEATEKHHPKECAAVREANEALLKVMRERVVGTQAVAA
jgi:hypothetical protein